MMMSLLESLRNALASVPGVQSCRIGLEDNISPDDYPIIRIVPSKVTALDTDLDGLPALRQIDTLIYFGMPLQPFDDVADGQGRVRLEKLYAALLDMETSMLNAITAPLVNVQGVTYQETITDEDRLDTFKLMALRCDVVG